MNSDSCGTILLRGFLRIPGQAFGNLLTFRIQSHRGTANIAQWNFSVPTGILQHNAAIELAPVRGPKSSDCDRRGWRECTDRATRVAILAITGSQKKNPESSGSGAYRRDGPLQIQRCFRTKVGFLLCLFRASRTLEIAA